MLAIFDAVAPSPLQGEGWDGGRVHQFMQHNYGK
jgi:hypothetical protein